jgi:hypothetical protein
VNDSLGNFDSFIIFDSSHRFCKTRIAGFHRIVGQDGCPPYILWDLPTGLLYKQQQLYQIVNIRKPHIQRNQDSLDRFLSRLLCIKAQVFEINTRNRRRTPGLCQIAPGPIQPFSRIIRGETLTGHIGLYPFAKQVE